MTRSVELPLWLLVLILLFAAVTFASHFLFPSVRWFFRRRFERAVARLNTRLERPIEPFKLTRRYDMIQRLIYDPEVARAIARHAAAEGIPENVAFEQARRYAREIVPSFSAFAYFGFAIRAARWLSNAIYRVRLGYQDEAALRQLDPNATLVFVMNHRSNMDYVLVTYLAARRSALSYAVGEWARVWPLSRLIKAMGAYFIRRKSRNDLYRRVLSAYMRLATQGGATQAMFPEGGLSLDGALAEPKLGLLKYIVEAGSVDAADPQGRDVVFVPVALNYDWVLEDTILTSAARAGERRFKARIGVIMARILRQLWLWMAGRYHRFGYAAVNFGAPLSLREFAKGQQENGGLDLRDTASREPAGGPTLALTTALATELMSRIGVAVPVLPVPLAAWLLLRHGAMRVEALDQHMAAMRKQMPSIVVHHHSASLATAAEEARRILVMRGLVTQKEELLVPVQAKLELLGYYANSVAHLLSEGPLGLGATDDAATASEISAPAKS
ncbi:1-acyl-sn-glycerol-3-phosphate acyltransferase [Pseudophaeobacter sp. EL27]|uniref:1-acyl-sn-glycerol-3-phosphate acyltransferase n=1 Tax=Pseudophaeobacter sp. EL27 TaxID=2107580 RepID=UPI000EFD7E90|nr:1-acyl-sn-glycerol-3-phosphate acyltransferase [Pseudophaeobacter sp. EL27]